jgi:hypothetical protein
MSDEISMIEITANRGGHMQQTQICNDNEFANDLSQSLLDAIVEEHRIPAVTEAIRQILAKEATEYTDPWVNRETGATLSELGYQDLPAWQTLDYERAHAREECKNPEEVE